MGSRKNSGAADFAGLYGKIIRGVGGFYDVASEKALLYRCRAKGVFRKEQVKPLPGDNVTFEITHEGDREGNITQILPRRNALLRPSVVNVDQALVIFAVTQPEVSHHLLGRFLVMMRMERLPVVLCFNKRDLADASEEAHLREIYGGCGAALLFVSALTGEGLSELEERLAGKTSVAAGPSGVGKSSLINALLSEERTETGQLSRKTLRGKNTTRHSELFLLPAKREGAADAFVFDTPGFMSLEPKGLTAKELHACYAEFEPYADACRYGGCTHLTEPDCAVKRALAEGAISSVRYDSYRLYYDELSGVRPVYVKKAKQGPNQAPPGQRK